MIMVYGGYATEVNLDLFQYKVFQPEVATSVKPEDLPPTKFHSWRTYLGRQCFNNKYC